jgi:hypothetical protein
MVQGCGYIGMKRGSSGGGHGMVRMLLTKRMVRIWQYWTYGCGQEGTFLAWG